MSTLKSILNKLKRTFFFWGVIVLVLVKVLFYPSLSMWIVFAPIWAPVLYYIYKLFKFAHSFTKRLY